MKDEMGKACSICWNAEKRTHSSQKPEGNKPLDRPGHRWKDDIKMGLNTLDPVSNFAVRCCFVQTNISDLGHVVRRQFFFS